MKDCEVYYPCPPHSNYHNRKQMKNEKLCIKVEAIENHSTSFYYVLNKCTIKQHSNGLIVISKAYNNQKYDCPNNLIRGLLLAPCCITHTYISNTQHMDMDVGGNEVLKVS
jgi:hypothetical protein